MTALTRGPTLCAEPGVCSGTCQLQQGLNFYLQPLLYQLLGPLSPSWRNQPRVRILFFSSGDFLPEHTGVRVWRRREGCAVTASG